MIRKWTVLALVLVLAAGMTTWAASTDKDDTGRMHKHSASTRTHSISGQVVSVDPANHSLVLRESGKKAREMTFSLADDAKVMVRGRSAQLNDLRAGERVTIHYSSESGGRHLARDIDARS